MSTTQHTIIPVPAHGGGHIHHDYQPGNEYPANMSPSAFYQEALRLLSSIEKTNRDAAYGRDPFNAMVGISATVPIILDYRNRKHILIFSANSLTLTLEDLGTFALSANTWTNISFPPGLRVFASGQVATVYVAIKQTDESS